MILMHLYAGAISGPTCMVADGPVRRKIQCRKSIKDLCNHNQLARLFLRELMYRIPRLGPDNTIGLKPIA